VTLDSYVALVTGGSMGIGFACAEALAKAGATVYITSRNATQGRDAAATLKANGNDVRYLRQDVTSGDDWRHVCNQIQKEAGALHILINNAGISKLTPMIDAEFSEVADVFETNLLGAYLGVKTCLSIFEKNAPSFGPYRGAIINISSILSRVAFEGASTYCASKGALSAMSTEIAEQESGRHALIKSLIVGYTLTPQIAKATEDQDEMIRRNAAFTLLDRWASPKEIAKCVIFTLSAGPWIEDQDIVIDGGVLAK
jgi:NAD(P)-dependent dehydrogenase (short-subunit alcohol dehydrogenase family)